MAYKRFSELTKHANNDPEHRAKVDAAKDRAAAEIVSYNLSQLRDSMAITQVELSEEMGISQGRVSRIETAPQLNLNTLKQYVEALGGHLELSAVFDDRRFDLNH